MTHETDDEQQSEHAPEESPAERLNGGSEAWPSEPGLQLPGEQPAAPNEAVGGEPSQAEQDAGDDSDAPITLDSSEVSGAGGDVRAQQVTISQGGAQNIDADSVSITQGGASRVEATTVTIDQGGAGMVRAKEINVKNGGIGLASTESLRLEEGGSTFAVMADKAHVDEGANVFLLVGRSVSGEVRPVVDWRAALAFGAALGAAFSVLRRRRR